MGGIRRVGPPTFEQAEGRLLIRFRLNREPDTVWLQHFKTQTLSKPLGRARAILDRRDLTVEVPTGSDLPEMVTALDCFIECANILSPPARRPLESTRVPA